jgi:hypothetical protein
MSQIEQRELIGYGDAPGPIICADL